MTIIVYHPDNRRAMFTYDAPYPPGITDLLDQHGHHYLVGASTDIPIHLVYIEEDGTVSGLKEFDIKADKTSVFADGHEEITFLGLPEGTEVSVDGNAMGIFSDKFVLAAAEEGIYDVRFSHSRYQDLVIKVTAS
jgi:hypothetical protein